MTSRTSKRRGPKKNQRPLKVKKKLQSPAHPKKNGKKRGNVTKSNGVTEKRRIENGLKKGVCHHINPFSVLTQRKNVIAKDYRPKQKEESISKSKN